MTENRRLWNRRWPAAVASAVLAIALLAAPALAQFGETSGGIHGRVADEQGGVLPGVSVTVKGPGAAQTVYADARGEFHVINLNPGMYTLTLALQGFTTVNRENVDVALGRDTELTISMKLSSVAATVTVSGEVPVLDTRKVETGAAITNEELKEIPTARDPWVVLQTIPGVLIDRMNVAGSESGQQSNVVAKGATAGTYQLDGVNMTDMSTVMATTSGSAAYFDFDSFQEMQAVTGGSDPSLAGSGAHLNMITKRGTNELHGSARIFDVDHHFESKNLPAEATTQVDTDGNPVPLSAGNSIQSVQDYGAEAGGPVWRDRVWLWGSYGRDQINLVTAGGAQDKTTLEDFNSKLNWQAVPSNSVETWYMRSDKLKFGRNAGPTHPQETTWDQILPQNTWKVQDSQVFSSSLFASVQYSGQNGNFVLSPEGGNQQAFLDGTGVWHNTYLLASAPRPQRQVRGDVSYFFNTGSFGHEVKAGFSYLKASANSATSWPPFTSGVGNDLAAATYGDLSDCSGDTIVPCAVLTRNGAFSVTAKYWGAFLGDTVTLDRLTVNVGLRWDEQYGINNPSNIPANPSFPGVLPGFDYPGRGKDFTWKDWQPRAGITYALGPNRNTLIKASYARYAETLGTSAVALPNNSAGAAYSYYGWNDANHDNLVQPNEVDLSDHHFDRNVNIAGSAPTNLVSPNLNAPRTWEVIGGVEHELFPSFAVGVNYTYRKYRGYLYGPVNTYDPTTGTQLTPADYEMYTTLTGTTPTGIAYSQPVYQIKQSVLESLGLCSDVGLPTESCSAPSGALTVNRPDFNETYSGVELVLTKRLANRWMMRASVVYNDNRQHVGANGCIDPTNQLSASTTNAQTCRDNDQVAIQSNGSGNKGSVFLNSKWQFNVVGMYQLPMGFNVAANVFGRQGYPIDWFVRTISPVDGLARRVVVTSADQDRYPSVFDLDLRLEKVMNIGATSTLTLSADLFNVTNQNTVLQRNDRINQSTVNTIREIQSPRIWRFGARIAF